MTVHVVKVMQDKSGKWVVATNGVWDHRISHASRAGAIAAGVRKALEENVSLFIQGIDDEQLKSPLEERDVKLL
ncbi:hypothetical protein [Cupriavidus necator]